MNITKIIVPIFLLAFCRVYGQDKVVISTPEASALAKSINFPVGYNTGVPDISVPLYEIKAGSLSIPVAISYNAGGFKINEKATDVGLGWSLSTNFQISRSVEGGDDFTPAGISNASYGGYYYNNVGFFLDNCTEYPGGCSGGYPTQSGQDLLRLVNNEYDRQPDRFYYNLLGKSGVFYFQKYFGSAPVAMTIPYNGVKIELVSANVFKITDTDGTVYWFGTSDDPNSSIHNTEFVYGPDDPSPTWVATSWKCTKIVSPSKADTVYFSYRTKPMEETWREQDRIEVIHNPDIFCGDVVYPDHYLIDDLDEWSELEIACEFYRLSSPKYWNYCYGPNAGFHMQWIYYDEEENVIYGDKNYGGANFGTRNRVYGLILDKITFNGGELEFTGTSPSTTTVVIKDDNATEIKTIKFDQNLYSYCLGGEGVAGTMYLDSIRIMKSNLVQEKYNFDYNKYCFGNLKGGDAWGGVNEYVQHRVEGYSSVPMQDVILANANCTSQPYTFTIGYGHKEPTPIPAQSGILQRITYPTGGYTDFTYGSNLYRTGEGDLRVAGGLRIEKIQYFDGSGSRSAYERIYKYGKNEDGAGILKLIPAIESWDLGYKYNQNVLYIVNWNPSTPLSRDVIETEEKTVYLSSSVRDMSFASGAPIHYTHVTEYQKDLGQLTGKTIYLYDTNAYNGYNPSYMVPGTNISIEESAWHMGKLKQETNYKYQGGVYDWVRQKTYDYISFEKDEQIRVEKAFMLNICNGIEETGYSPSDFNHTIYGLKVGTMLLSREEESLKENGNTLTTVNQYYYHHPDNHILPNRIVTTSSDGKVIVNYTSYPSDYATGNTFVDTLRINHMLDKPVEKITAEEVYSGPNVASLKILSGQLITYKGDSTGLPHKIYSLELAEPLSSDVFKFSNRTNGYDWPWYPGNNVAYGADSRYKEKLSFPSYDNRGNSLVLIPKDNIPLSYVWDYKKQYPVAEVKNVSDANEIAFTSFEADNKGNWTFSGTTPTHPTAPTGTKGYSLAGGNITKSGVILNTIYNVTYWKRDSAGTVTVNGTNGTALVTRNGWTLCSHEITETTCVTVSGTAYIDELRLYPIDARMTTYTYTPLIGMTSQSDATNKIIYYEYDSFNRLKLIKDQDKNIIKVLDYKYQQNQNQ